MKIIANSLLLMITTCVIVLVSPGCDDDSDKTETLTGNNTFTCTEADNTAMQEKALAETIPSKKGSAYCSDCTACVVLEPSDSGQSYYYYNPQKFDITITVEFTQFENAKADAVLPYTGISKALTSDKKFTVTQNDKTKAWNTYFYFYYNIGSPAPVHNDNYLYSLPYMPGKKFSVAQGYNGAFSHFGDFAYSLDFDMLEKEIVTAARGGIVGLVKDSFDGNSLDPSSKLSTNFVMIVHDDGTIAEYDHIIKNGSLVSTGSKVSAGDKIAYSGNVGYSSGPHLHFMVFRAITGKQRESLPVKFITKEGSGIVPEQNHSYTSVPPK